MRILQGPCLQYTDINQAYRQRAQQGKWYQLKPRTFLVYADDKYLAIALNCLERIAAIFLRLFHIDYFQRTLKAKTIPWILTPSNEKSSAPTCHNAQTETVAPSQKPSERTIRPIQLAATQKTPSPIPQPLIPPTPVAQQHVEQKPADYDLDKTLEQVRAQAAAVDKLHKKHCLFLCRGAEQTVPQNPDEVWVTLDRTYEDPLDPNRIHVQMDINDKRMQKLFGLFDRVILDCACLSTIAHRHPWLLLRDLLKKSPQAELITETIRTTTPFGYENEDHLLRSPIPHHNDPGAAGVIYPIVRNWDDAKKKAAKHVAIEATLPHIQGFLERFFTTVVLKRQQPFPCQMPLRDYFIMTGPKA